MEVLQVRMGQQHESHLLLIHAAFLVIREEYFAFIDCMLPLSHRIHSPKWNWLKSSAVSRGLKQSRCHVVSTMTVKCFLEHIILK